MKKKEKNRYDVKTQVSDGVMKSVFSFKPYRKSIWESLTGKKLPDMVTNDDIDIYNLEANIGNHVQNDICFLLKDEMLLLVESQSSINPVMDFRLVEYYILLVRQWLTEHDMETSSHPEHARIPPFLMRLIYTGDRENVSLEDFMKGLYPLGLDLRTHIELLTKKNATGYILEYILFDDVWKKWKRACPREEWKMAIIKTVDECHKAGILKEWIEKKGIDEVVNIMTYGEILAQDWEIAKRNEVRHAEEAATLKERKRQEEKSRAAKRAEAQNLYRHTQDLELVCKIFNFSLEEAEKIVL